MRSGQRDEETYRKKIVVNEKSIRSKSSRKKMKKMYIIRKEGGGGGDMWKKMQTALKVQEVYLGKKKNRRKA